MFDRGTVRFVRVVRDGGFFVCGELFVDDAGNAVECSCDGADAVWVVHADDGEVDGLLFLLCGCCWCGCVAEAFDGVVELFFACLRRVICYCCFVCGEVDVRVFDAQCFFQGIFYFLDAARACHAVNVYGGSCGGGFCCQFF